MNVLIVVLIILGLLYIILNIAIILSFLGSQEEKEIYRNIKKNHGIIWNPRELSARFHYERWPSCPWCIGDELVYGIPGIVLSLFLAKDISKAKRRKELSKERRNMLYRKYNDLGWEK